VVLLSTLSLFAGTHTVTSYAGVATYTCNPHNKWWSFTNNLPLPPDGQYTTSALSDPTVEPQYSIARCLHVSDFGLDIPCNAVITDLSFNVTRRNSEVNGSVIIDDGAYLKLDNYQLSTMVVGAGGTWLNSNTGNELFSYSHTNWGVTLTGDMLSTQIFGAVLELHNAGPGIAQAEIDAVQIEVCYDLPSGTAATNPITFTTVKVEDACDQNSTDGSISISASGGISSAYQFSIDNGATWSGNNVFSNLNSGNYQISVRNAGGECMTWSYDCHIGTINGNVLQPGDAIVACKPSYWDPNGVTLTVDRIQPFHDHYNNGYQSYNVSQLIEPHPISWTATELCGPVFSTTIDPDHTIYTGTTNLYQIENGTGNPMPPVISRIDPVTGAVTKIETLPGIRGIGYIDHDEVCDQLFATNMDDGKIYRVGVNGGILSSFDPLSPDDGVSGLAPLGERLLGVAFNAAENRLYYSVWANDAINNGAVNTIRSVAISPTNCNFVAGTDMLEVTLPFLSATGGYFSSNYSNPVGDIEFSDDGTIMLLAETGFDSGTPVSSPHKSRLLQYDGSTGNWQPDFNDPTGNLHLKYELGQPNNGTNARGGIAFAYAGMDALGCTQNPESFIVATGDALKGTTCVAEGCYYGLAYIDEQGGNVDTSILHDVANTPLSQEKSVYGDVDVILGCCAALCPVQPCANITVIKN